MLDQCRRVNLMEITVASLEELGGGATEKGVCRWIWERYQSELQADEDLFFTWQLSVHRNLGSLMEQGRVTYCAKSSEWLLVEAKYPAVTLFDVEPIDRSAKRKEIALLYEYRA